MQLLSDAIISKDIGNVRKLVRYTQDINALDEYGYTPLIEAAIMDDIEIAKILLEHGADANAQDMAGGTALHWATENSDIDFCELLIKHHANVNAYNLAGQPVLVMPILRQQSSLRQLLLNNGADLVFAQDYINVKLLGHMYELMGPALIVDPKNNYVEVNFEGFYLEVTLGILSEALLQFQNHFAARKLQRYSGIAKLIVKAMQRAQQLTKYQQYRVDRTKVAEHIDELLQHEPMIIPVGYEGHAITFIKAADIWVKCDRREDSRLYDHVAFYRITHPENMNTNFIKSLMFVKQSDDFINNGLDEYLGLQPITELKVEAQISGNCSWANVEAAIPAFFFLVMLQLNEEKKSMAYYKTLALNFFHRFRDWNKERALFYCIKAYEEGDILRKASKAEILAAILFQRSNVESPLDQKHIRMIVELLIDSPYQYILKNYLRTYYYNNPSEEGAHFAKLLKEFGYPK